MPEGELVHSVVCMGSKALLYALWAALKAYSRPEHVHGGLKSAGDPETARLGRFLCGISQGWMLPWLAVLDSDELFTFWKRAGPRKSCRECLLGIKTIVNTRTVR